MNIAKDLRYAATHEWAREQNGIVRVGISDHAQHEITDVVHIELPPVGKQVTKGQPCAVVESVKAAFDIYAPVSGTITAVNEKVVNNPELVNQSPYDDGYFFDITVSDASQIHSLLSADDYQKSIAQ